MQRFIEAIVDLPLGNLHAKAAELRNSIAHLESSNAQLQQYVAEGDLDCADATRENKEVIERMKARIELLKQEVERRGFQWGEEVGSKPNGELGEGQSRNNAVLNGELETNSTHNENQGNMSGIVGDEELTRRPQEHTEAGDGESSEGVHL